MPKEEKKRSFPIIPAILVFIILGYSVFFTSKIWMFSNKDYIEATQLNRPIIEGTREISIVSWKYSAKQALMEVELSIINNAMDGINNYDYQVVERNNGELQIEKVIEAADLVVLMIKNVPEKWEEISLRMLVPAQDNTSSVLKMYANKNSVAHVDDILPKEEIDYRMAHLEEIIKGYEVDIKELQEKISVLDKNIEGYKSSIAEVSERMIYQTEQEKFESEALIEQANQNIESAEKRKEELNEQINEFTQKIEVIRNQITDLLGN